MNGLGDRAAIRAELASVLAVEMTGDGQLVQQIFPCTVKDFGGQSPVIVLGSGGSERAGLTLRGSRAGLLIDVWIFVLYADLKLDEDNNTVLNTDPDTGEPVWDEADSEAALDAIEEQLATVVNCMRGASWKSVEYAGQTTPGIETVGDQVYRRELVPLRFKQF